MSVYDPQKAARVWNRVQAQPEATPLEAQLQALVTEENRSAATYFRLSRQLPSRPAAILQRMGRDEQNHCACLKGIFTLVTCSQPTIKTPAQETGAPETVLRQCYARQMRILKEYESRCDDNQFGAVFSRLAEQEREHCKTLLTLLGMLQEK